MYWPIDNKNWPCRPTHLLLIRHVVSNNSCVLYADYNVTFDFIRLMRRLTRNFCDGVRLLYGGEAQLMRGVLIGEAVHVSQTRRHLVTAAGNNQSSFETRN